MKYTLAAPAYGGQVGDEVTLDASNPLVGLNVAAGVLVPTGDPAKMTCPACRDAGMKRPKKFADQAELEGHYDERHPGLVTPTWKEEGESE